MCLFTIWQHAKRGRRKVRTLVRYTKVSDLERKEKVGLLLYDLCTYSKKGYSLK